MKSSWQEEQTDWECSCACGLQHEIIKSVPKSADKISINIMVCTRLETIGITSNIKMSEHNLYREKGLQT